MMVMVEIKIIDNSKYIRLLPKMFNLKLSLQFKKKNRFSLSYYVPMYSLHVFVCMNTCIYM